MAAPQLASPNGVKPAVEPPLSHEQRKQLLAETLVKKLEQGFRIESQTDTDAILVTKGRRRGFGIFGNEAETRQTTSIDEQGRTTTRPA
jgi:hypothetical protein